jgi:UDP-N-acetylmuramate dehydrogenase
MVVKNNYSKLELIHEDENKILLLVSSGYSVSRLVNETIEKGWLGFQYHKGLPGTVGGAIYNNSKWTKPLCFFSDNLVEAYLVDENGKEKKVDREYFQFAYDFSILHKTKEILLEAVFKLTKADSGELKKQAQIAFDYRRQTQPQGVFTSGCFFQNISGKSAGEMIDKAGLKGFRVGNFQVSKKHANFIINTGDGKAEDLKKLIQIIKNKVKNKFGVELKEEVILI